MSLTATARFSPLLLIAAMAAITAGAGGCVNATGRSTLSRTAFRPRLSDDSPDEISAAGDPQDEFLKQAGIRRLPPVDEATRAHEPAVDGAIAAGATQTLRHDPLVRPAASWEPDLSFSEPWSAQPEEFDVFSPHSPPPAERRGEDVTFAGLLADQMSHVRSDHLEFYSPEGLASLAVGLGSASLMANTAFDEHFLRDKYFESIIRAPTDEYYEKLHQPKFLGEGYYTIPVFAAAALSEPLVNAWPIGSQTAEWGQRSLRTILVGGPPMLGLQVVTGGSRPGESSAESHWKPLDDDNGASGHAFMGAIPFLSAAKMTDDFWLKGGLYAASALPALSRVNDDDHYFSQAFLGWWVAYVAATAIDRPDDGRTRQMVYPFVTPTQIGLGMQRAY